MKFKLFFGMLIVFASFTSLSAQNYLPADQAMTVLEDTARNVESGVTQAPSSISTAPDQLTGVRPSVLAASNNANYARLLRFFAEEIGNTKDTASGYANAVARMDAAGAQAELGNMQIDIQNLISN